MDIPYSIVSFNARLRKLAHIKTATCLALIDFKEGDAELNNFCRIFREQFTEPKKPKKGVKSQMRELEKILLQEQNKKGLA